MKRILLISLFSMTSFVAQAGYLSILESGEILPEGQYQFGVAPQLLLNNGSGADVDGFLDAPINDDLSVRGIAGFGTIDFHVGGSVKYVPFPDIDNQPAIGGKAGVWYARINGQNISTIQVGPLLSRHFDTDQGRFIPYVAVPFNINSSSARNYTGTQFVGGTEWRNPDWPNMLMAAELAVSLNDSYSALNFSVAFPFDGKRGFRTNK